MMARNIVANSIGRLWAAVANVVFVPLYLRLLGGDGYGLIVAYTTLFASLQVLDAGLSSALSRELALRIARKTNPDSMQSAVDLTRTIELISMSTGMLVGVAVVLIAPLIAESWLVVPPAMHSETVQSVRLIGVIIAAQWSSMAYQGAMMGLQDQVRVNLVRMVTSSIQPVGALLVLKALGANTEYFFCWVLVIQLANTVALRQLVWSHLRKITAASPTFRWTEVLGIWRFAGGVATIALLSALLTQADKIVLSKYVPIAEFGVYGIAYTVAGVLGLLAQPVLSSMLPRLAQLFDVKDLSELNTLYRSGCELVAFFTFPCWVILAFHPDELMRLWMGLNPEGSLVARLLPVLASGTLANALVTLPYGMQLASGWTSLSVTKNIVTTVLAIPAMILVIPRQGAMGAAVIWLLVNCGYLFVEIPIMHLRLPIGSLRAWYGRVLTGPIAVAAVIGVVSTWYHPALDSKSAVLGVLTGYFVVTAAGLLIIMPDIRRMFTTLLWAAMSAR